MDITLYNTLTGKKEIFVPLRHGYVSMYHCGPTVYTDAHIGNLRAYVFADTLRRVFEFNGFKVKQVINITDVGHLTSDADTGDDKMTKGLRRQGKPITIEAMRELADFYTTRFKEDLANLSILPPHQMPRASDTIKEDIEIIEVMEQKGFVYKTSDGMYFEVSKFPRYGILGNRGGDATTAERRIAEKSQKRDPRDFAVWKFNPALGWDSPWGKGFPGWHLECSAMSRKYLGQPFDIHTGGIDHISIHHNNELAQSESAYDRPLARFWLHGEFLTAAGKKMSKSSDNFLTLLQLNAQGIPSLAYRYWLLGGHYRSPLTFSLEALQGAHKGFSHLIHLLALCEGHGTIMASVKSDFLAVLNDDLNTPRAVALVWDTVRNETYAEGDRLATILHLDGALGLNLVNLVKERGKLLERIPKEVNDLLRERDNKRAAKQWAEADKTRSVIEEKGYKVIDTTEGSYLDLK